MATTVVESPAMNGSTSDADGPPTTNGTPDTSADDYAASKSTSAARKATETWLRSFAAALAAKDADAAAALFAPESYWRDLVAFTWNLVTVEHAAGVRDLLQSQLPHVTVNPATFCIAEEPTDEGGVPTAWFAFETGVGRGRGLLRLQDGKAWTLLTTLEELKGFEEPLNGRRPKGVEHGSTAGRQSWTESREDEARTLGYERQPYVLIVGGGQGGIALAARLKQLAVSTIIIDKHRRPGDQWRSRYKSLCLHDPVWYDHMPYLPVGPRSMHPMPCGPA